MQTGLLQEVPTYRTQTDSSLNYMTVSRPQVTCDQITCKMPPAVAQKMELFLLQGHCITLGKQDIDASYNGRHRHVFIQPCGCVKQMAKNLTRSHEKALPAISSTWFQNWLVTRVHNLPECATWDRSRSSENENGS